MPTAASRVLGRSAGQAKARQLAYDQAESPSLRGRTTLVEIDQPLDWMINK